MEAFTEWGIAIERAFLHLGQKVETGISNAGNRFANALRDSVNNACSQIGTGIEDGLDRTTDAISSFGLTHADHYKRVYSRELTVLLIGFLIIAASAFLYSLAFLIAVIAGDGTSSTAAGIDAVDGSRNGIVGAKLVSFAQLVNIVAFMAFAALNGYIIYSWNRYVETAASITTGPDNTIQEEFEETRQISRHGQILDNPKVLFVVVGASGFVAGQIIRNLFQMTSFKDTGNLLNVFLSIAIMVLLTLFMYKVFTFNLFYRLYSLKMDISEFLEWRRQRVQQDEHQVHDVSLTQKKKRKKKKGKELK